MGRKTGARLLVELRNRLVPEDGSAPVVPGVPMADGGGGGVRGDVAEALAQLGYAPDEVAGILGWLPESDDPAELLREALRRLAVG